MRLGPVQGSIQPRRSSCMQTYPRMEALAAPPFWSFRLPCPGSFRHCTLHLCLGKDRCPLVLQMCYLSNSTYIHSRLEMFKQMAGFFSTLFLDISGSWIPVHCQFISFIIFITIVGILPATIYIRMSCHNIFQTSLVFRRLFLLLDEEKNLTEVLILPPSG